MLAEALGKPPRKQRPGGAVTDDINGAGDDWPAPDQFGNSKHDPERVYYRQRKATMPDNPVIFCDLVQSVRVDDGTVHFVFIRLDASGQAMPALELLMPVREVDSLARALKSVVRTVH